MVDLPQGTVTYLFTDVEGSTKLWEDSPELMMTVVGLHDGVIDRAVDANDGFSVKPRGEGDSRFLVFENASHAVAAAADIQRGLTSTDWPTLGPVLVRIAIHTGVAELESGDYYGSVVNRTARLRALAHGGQTVISAATFELIKDDLPADTTVRDLGRHGLKDLTRPEHVFQIDIAGLQDTFPPLKSLEGTPNNLPIQLTEFVGRDLELEEAKRGVADSRLLTILAPGGAGKTRLAIQTAAELTGNFPDGVFFVDLAPIAASDEIPQAVFESVGVPIASGDDMRAQLLAYLADKKQLLVMDNFEHVIAGTELISEILNTAPQVKVIATSRSKLGVHGESVLLLSGLGASWNNAEEANQSEAVQLFVEAARRADLDFQLADSDLEPLSRVFQSVEGMPLGILLAAAWVDTLGIDEIASEISKSLDFLESDVDGSPDRHRSMRAVFDYSLSMLDEEERLTLLALSIFKGGFSREAAQSVANASVRGLANLTRKSLLTADRESGRYSIHELLRQYAAEQLSGQTGQHEELYEPTIAAYVEFYSQLAAESEILIYAGGQKTALAMLEADIDNIRSAWRHSVNGSDVIAIRRFVLGLWFLYEVRGWHQAAHGLLEQAVNGLPSDSGDEMTVIAREAAAGALGKFVAYLGQPKEGADLSQRAAAKLSKTSDRYAELMALEARCDGLAYLGDWAEIREVSIKAIGIADKHDCKWPRAGMPNWLALAEAQLGNMEEALSAVEDGNQRLLLLGDDFFLAWNVMVKATMEAMSGHLEDAAESNIELIRLSRGLGFQRTLWFGLLGLGDVKAAAGDLGEAQEAFVECLATSEEMGAVIEVAGMMTRIANIRVEMGLTEDAVEILTCVLSDPVSQQTMINETETIGEVVTKSLEPLQAAIKTQTYEAAAARGAKKSLKVAARELLDDQSTLSPT